jgi:hypothetical protein
MIIWDKMYEIIKCRRPTQKSENSLVWQFLQFLGKQNCEKKKVLEAEYYTPETANSRISMFVKDRIVYFVCRAIARLHGPFRIRQ